MNKVHNWLIFIFTIPAICMAWEWDVTPFADYLRASIVVYVSFLLLILKYALWEGKDDADQYPNKIEHTSSSIVRVVLFITLFFALNFTGVFGWLKGSLILLLSGFPYSLVFSLRYNSVRGLNRLFVGTTAIYDKKLGKGKWIVEIIGTLLIMTLL